MNTRNKIEAILKALNARAPEVEASAVVTRDGLVVASALSIDIETERVAAMCAALLGLGDTAASELERGRLKLLLLHGEKGVLLLIHVGQHHVLTLSASTEIKLGALLMEARRTASVIQAELGGTS